MGRSAIDEGRDDCPERFSAVSRLLTEPESKFKNWPKMNFK
jgi:hypothetical protein